MALNGINLPLAFTGQEALWQEVCATLVRLKVMIQYLHLTRGAVFKTVLSINAVCSITGSCKAGFKYLDFLEQI